MTAALVSSANLVSASLIQAVEKTMSVHRARFAAIESVLMTHPSAEVMMNVLGINNARMVSVSNLSLSAYEMLTAAPAKSALTAYA
jgi:hypothetical protein